MGVLSSLMGPSIDYKELMNKGGVILDVRTKAEYSLGHIKGSTNIPLAEIQTRMKEVKKLGEPIITCCASGNRSGVAKSMIKKEGIEVFNGGGWQSLKNKI